MAVGDWNELQLLFLEQQFLQITDGGLNHLIDIPEITHRI
jgi:hypothetical protein